jgi:hypothetical protein
LLNQEEFNYTQTNYNLYDTGLCKILSGGEPFISTASTEGDLGLLIPKETRSIEWSFEAPSADKIANIKITCPIRFRFDFSYQAKSQVDVLVIDSNHFSELQRAGTTFLPTVNVGRGPIKTYFDFGTTLPVKNDSNLPVYIRVEDKGTGVLQDIGAGDFKIKFPIEFDISNINCPYFDKCSNLNECTIESNVPIPIINKKSLDIRCSGIKTPADIGVPEKTYFISSFLDYKYYVAGEVDVEVNPK